MNSALRHNAQMVFVMIALESVTQAAHARGEIIYVDGSAPSGGDGSSWASAHRFLQDGLLAAYAGATIRVAAGIYRPDRDEKSPNGTLDPNATFLLHGGLNAVQLEGGYRGLNSAGIDPNQRDPEAWPSILSGDLLGDDGPGMSNQADNSCHIVTTTEVSRLTLIEGFIITSGNAEGATATAYCPVAPNHKCGGGMENADSGSPTIRRCVFRQNRAIGGGAMWNICGSDPLVADCLFEQNVVGSGAGGAILCYGDSRITVVNCTFKDNHTSHVGGAIALKHGGAAPTIVVNSVFIGNSAGDAGGAVRCGVATSSIFCNCTFVANSCGPGAPILPIPAGGGAISVGKSIAGEQYPASTAIVRNCVLWGNTVSGAAQGSQIAVNSVGEAYLAMAECDVQNSDPGEPGVYVQPGTGLSWTGLRLDADPLFMDITGPTPDLRLRPGSPCIGRGGNSDVASDIADLNNNGDREEPTPFDLEGLPRFCLQETVDIGAFEGAAICPADIDGDGHVTVGDLLSVVFSTTHCEDWPQACLADIEPAPCGDGAVSIGDLLKVISEWGDCPDLATLSTAGGK